ncbi:MAG: hypothetical protein BWY09_02970 [Candidatus Hydrogenedentes bacterium ADurb.Bin179]|jgi:hypothetical protein|nr:MAG: hypothetical protein BWY09_02970 [Candidatus Hydrogenedentes bacterium ADurb.Bin179]
MNTQALHLVTKEYGQPDLAVIEEVTEDGVVFQIPTRAHKVIGEIIEDTAEHTVWRLTDPDAGKSGPKVIFTPLDLEAYNALPDNLKPTDQAFTDTAELWEWYRRRYRGRGMQDY